MAITNTATKPTPYAKAKYNADTHTVGMIFSKNSLIMATKTPPVADKYLDKYNIKNPNVYIGLEFEVENIKLGMEGTIGEAEFKKFTMAWNVIHDDSLRNNGYEFVSQPLKGEELSKAYYRLQKVFNVWKGAQKIPPIEFLNGRTSTHVHIDARRLTISQVIMFVLVYAMCERVLYKYLSNHSQLPDNNRYHNTYCNPLLDSTLTYLITKMFDWYENGELTKSRFISCVHNWSKYSALNLSSLSKYGTIEFRQCHGTDDVLFVSKWVNLIMCIHDFVISKDVSVDKIKNTIKDIHILSSYDVFLDQVFGKHSAYLGDLEDLEENILSDVSTLNQIVSGELDIPKTENGQSNYEKILLAGGEFTKIKVPKYILEKETKSFLGSLNIEEDDEEDEDDD